MMRGKPEPDVARRYPNKKKNTTDYCLGRQGRLHDPEVRKPQSTQYQCRTKEDGPFWERCWHAMICKNCGKILRYLDPKQCPDRPSRNN